MSSRSQRDVFGDYGMDSVTEWTTVYLDMGNNGETNAQIVCSNMLLPNAKNDKIYIDRKTKDLIGHKGGLDKEVAASNEMVSLRREVIAKFRFVPCK